MNTLDQTCFICEKHFSKKCNLYRHIREVHGLEPEYEKKIKCPDINCNATFQNHTELRSHISSIHGIQCDIEELKFETKNGMIFVVIKFKMFNLKYLKILVLLM